MKKKVKNKKLVLKKQEMYKFRKELIGAFSFIDFIIVPSENHPLGETWDTFVDHAGQLYRIGWGLSLEESKRVIKRYLDKYETVIKFCDEEWVNSFSKHEKKKNKTTS